MPEPYRIRSAAACDVESIDRMLRGLAEFVGEQDCYRGDLEALKQYGFGDQAVFQTLIAEQNRSAAGLCIFYPVFSTWRCRPGVYILDLYIAESHRGGGLGKRLLSQAVLNAKASWQADYVHLDVHRANHAAFEFYRRLGFTPDRNNRVMRLADQALDTFIHTGPNPGSRHS